MADNNTSGGSGITTASWYLYKNILHINSSPPSNITPTASGQNLPLSSIGSPNDVPWYSYRSSIIEVEIVPSTELNSLFTTAFWFAGCTNLKYGNWEDLPTQNVTTMMRMFVNVGTNLSSPISLALDWNTTSLTNTSGMFLHTGISELSLYFSNTSNITNSSQMFTDNFALKHIFVNEGFDLTGVSNSAGMFARCTNLVGGEGTTWDSTIIDSTRACIDEAGVQEGYFTKIEAPQLQFPHGSTSISSHDIFHPIGQIYETKNSINPNLIFKGGIWEDQAVRLMSLDNTNDTVYTDNATNVWIRTA